MRASGILMPVFSLPGPFGIGTLGKEAFAFVDFLAEAKQTYWRRHLRVSGGLGRQPLLH